MRRRNSGSPPSGRRRTPGPGNEGAPAPDAAHRPDGSAPTRHGRTDPIPPEAFFRHQDLTAAGQATACGLRTFRRRREVP
ncbi:hypothetical protein CP967_03355 [Streptomyces nitrosporeus]|uniref:Uncharacterized protein n=1 Tax=Streptomyces nitrosporeus TaxID=28894 RepID=A0A5J6F507_9ACTN|nr:hypothetical protein CP967_03355 [Streptomyces nitrosporeus]